MIKVNLTEIHKSIKCLSKYKKEEILSVSIYKGVKRKEYIIPAVAKGSASEIVLWKLAQDGITNKKYCCAFIVAKGKMADKAVVHYINCDYVGKILKVVGDSEIFLEKYGEKICLNDRKKHKFLYLKVFILLVLLVVSFFAFFSSIDRSSQIIIKPAVKLDIEVKDYARVCLEKTFDVIKKLNNKNIFVENLLFNLSEQKLIAEVWSYSKIKDEGIIDNVFKEKSYYRGCYFEQITKLDDVLSKEVIGKNLLMEIVQMSGLDLFEIRNVRKEKVCTMVGRYNELYSVTKCLDQFLYQEKLYKFVIKPDGDLLRLEACYRRTI